MIEPLASTEWHRAQVVRELCSRYRPLRSPHAYALASELLSLTDASSEADCFIDALAELAWDVEITVAIASDRNDVVSSEQCRIFEDSLAALATSTNGAPSLVATVRMILARFDRASVGTDDICAWAAVILDGTAGASLAEADERLYLRMVDLAYALDYPAALQIIDEVLDEG
ncbi:hypothetical protein SAMN04488550_0957 [Gordonia malaquae]|uniref:Uncharacterized protein n=1 Tax=Gordonia malaquae NBRC 108250 TaxID=1223542 RepID=M3TIS7_GORML|nr:hypothetical protein GM1_034_00130 [Gordonia malaquae NBRC 108250]SEB88453.1 hypothetical protein SAMN04488550_0957 [Gordonia malaquae]